MALARAPMSDLLAPPPVPAGLLHPHDLLDALESHVAIVNLQGTVVYVNRAWREFARRNGGDPNSTGVGSNYLAASAANPVMREGIEAVLQGKRPSFELSYPCHAPHERRWFRVRVVPLWQGEHIHHALVEHVNISREARWQEELWRTRKSLSSRVAARTAALRRHNEDLASRAGALEAFAQFTEATAQTGEPQLLAREADRVLRATLGDVAVAYCARTAGRPATGHPTCPTRWRRG